MSYAVLFVPMMIGHVFMVSTFLIIGICAWIFGRFTKASNCYFWAIQEWVNRGGCLVIVKSRFGWWLHFRHMDREGIVREYVTKEPPRKRALPPPLFHGRVRVVRK